VPKVMRQGQRLRVFFVQLKSVGDRSRDLSDLNRVSQAIAEVIPEVNREDLCFTLQTAERTRVNNPVAITLKIVAIRVGWLRKSAAAQTQGTKT
jgi:hypothetical protein